MIKPALSIKEICLSLPLGVAVQYAHAPTVSVSAVISRPICFAWHMSERVREVHRKER